MPWSFMVLGTAPLSRAGRASGDREPVRMTRLEFWMGAVMRGWRAVAWDVIWAVAGRVAKTAMAEQTAMESGCIRVLIEMFVIYTRRSRKVKRLK
jgi:hypothetical protein